MVKYIRNWEGVFDRKGSGLERVRSSIAGSIVEVVKNGGSNLMRILWVKQSIA